MQALLSISFLFVFLNVPALFAGTMQLAEKTDEELAVLLRQPDRVRQVEALAVLATRYRQPGEVVIRSKVPFQGAYPLDKSVSALIVSNTLGAARSDQDTAVRVAALDFMKVLLARTNIVESFHEFLSDLQVAPRLRACGAIIGHAKQQGTPIPPEVVDSLIRSLDQTNDSGSLCVALAYVGEIGAQASKSLPQVSALRKHANKEVRAAAKAALKVIQTGQR